MYFLSLIYPFFEKFIRILFIGINIKILMALKKIYENYSNVPNFIIPIILNLECLIKDNDKLNLSV